MEIDKAIAVLKGVEATMGNANILKEPLQTVLAALENGRIAGNSTPVSAIELCKEKCLGCTNGGASLCRRFRHLVEDNCCIRLPVPIGAPVFAVYRFAEEYGKVVEGVVETRLSGYIKEDDREFYTTHDSVCGCCDVEPDKLFLTRDDAEKALAAIKDGKKGGGSK